MIDIRLLRENPEAMKENIRKRFQEQKPPLVNEVIMLDEESRKTQVEADQLRSDRNKTSESTGALMRQDKKDETEKAKEEVAKVNERFTALESREVEITTRIREIILTIPQIMDSSISIDKDDSCNVEVQRYGEPVVPNFEIPYHTDIMECLHSTDLEAAGKIAGNGFHYLFGDVTRLHSAVLSYTRDFTVDCGFTYMIPPCMIHSDVVTGMMDFPEMDAIMYKIKGEDLYLIGMSEHSMTSRFIGSANNEAKLPYTLISYSLCFCKEKSAHGIEEHGVYCIHQFGEQEMIVVRKPGELTGWYNKLWQNAVDLFRSLDIPVRVLECCSNDFADLKIKSCDVGTWSPRQRKYFEVGSCLNLGGTQAHRFHVYAKGVDDKKYLAHTLNNTYIVPPRTLTMFLENNPQADGSVRTPGTLRSYMGGKSELRA